MAEPARPDRTERPERLLWLAAFSAVVCPAIPLLGGVLAPGRDPMPFVGTLIVLLAPLGLMVWSAIGWARTPRAPGAAAHALDYVQVALCAVAAAGALVLVALLASAFGIRGSAWPRVQQGIPLPADLPYLGAGALAIATLAAAFVTLLLLARTHLSEGTFVDDAARARSAQRAAVPRPIRGPRPVATREDDGWWHRMVSPRTRLLTVVMGLLAAAGLGGAAVLPGPFDTVAGWTSLLAASVVTVWSVMESLWRVDEQMGVAMGGLYRVLVIPFVVSPPIGLLISAASLLPPVADALPGSPWGQGWEERIPGDASSIAMVGAGIFLPLLFAMLAGLAAAVFLLLPIGAFLFPAQLVQDNMMSTDPQHLRRNVAAIRMLSLLLALVFAVPTLLVMADQGSALWWVGIVLIPLGLFAIWYVWHHQRVDHGRRAQWGLQARVSNPEDPARSPTGSPAGPPEKAESD